MSTPLVVIIGRANVGKSTLFNRLTEKRTAIVNDTPGVTRDRIYGQSEWLGKTFRVIDTGGLDVDNKDAIEVQIKEQGQLAQAEADSVIFVVDNRQGLTPVDRDVIAQIRKTGKPMLVAVNKVDDPAKASTAYEFSRLGVETVYPISAEHGFGVAELLDDLVAQFPETEEAEVASDSIKVAIVGKPNAGKSSLVNKLLGTYRCIVSDVPGTTRDAIDTEMEFEGQKILLIDTAGIRRKGKTLAVLDKFSVIMALKALDRCDVAVIVVDAAEGISDQDAHIAGYAYERGRACLIVANKWDLAKAGKITFQDFEEQVQRKLKFLDFVPVIPISAKTGEKLERLLPGVIDIFRQYIRNIPTAALNDCFIKAIQRTPIAGYQGKFVKILYATQVKNRPPTFRCFVNYPKGIHFSYRRYLINSLRKTFGFSGTPVWLMFTGKKERH